MSLSAARRLSPLRLFVRAGLRVSVAGACLLGANNSLQTAIAEGDTRTLSFHHLHTGEDITITFKRDGRYDDAALKKLDWFMRDWRKDEQVHMDPRLFDLLWETYREVGATQPIQVIGGYRSPSTNSMLRARSSGVAQFSQHTQGHAIDFAIPGVPLEKVRIVGLQLQRGGVGFYPTSGSPFVHMDTGTIRHWPRMTYAQLSKVFPDGRTVHMPSDGHPLPGYALALADVERRGNRPNTNSLEAARTAGVITTSQEQEAENVTGQQPRQKSLFAGLFNFGKQKDAEETADEQSVAASKPAPKRGRIKTTVASLVPPKPVATERVVPLPAARPVALAAATPQPAESPFTTAALPPFELASAGTAVTGTSAPDALAYAPESNPAQTPAARMRPMGKTVPKLAREDSVMPATGNNSVVAKAAPAPQMMIGGQRADSPWLRAAMLTPSVRGFMTATHMGDFDTRTLHPLIYKPAQSVVMTFSADQSLGMVAERFGGPAVVFLATATFTSQTTASLR